MSGQRRAIVFANGLVEDYVSIPELIEPEDLIIAADGGALHCKRLGLTPAYLVGDFDSLPEEDLNLFIQNGAEVIRHPVRKDYTDLELALLQARDVGAAQILVFGGLGARWDQTLANLLLPASINLLDVSIRLRDGKQELTMLHSGDSLSIQGEPGDIVSLIPIGGDVHGISTQGLEYPLKDETLHLGATRGISNLLIETSGSVSLKQGALVCVVIHQPAAS